MKYVWLVVRRFIRLAVSLPASVVILPFGQSKTQAEIYHGNGFSSQIYNAFYELWCFREPCDGEKPYYIGDIFYLKGVIFFIRNKGEYFSALLTKFVYILF